MCWRRFGASSMNPPSENPQGLASEAGARDRVLQSWEQYVRQFDAERRTSGAPEITQEAIAQEIESARAQRRAGFAPSPSGRGLG